MDNEGLGRGAAARGGRARGRGRVKPTAQPPRVGESYQEDDSTSQFAGSESSTVRTFAPNSVSSGDSDDQSSVSTRLSSTTIRELSGSGDSNSGSSAPSYAPSTYSSRFEDVGSAHSSTGSKQSLVSGFIQTIAEGFNKYGESGEARTVSTNYYAMNECPSFILYQYRVDFTPVEDHTRLKKQLLRQHEGVLGNYIFDGSMLHKTNVITKEHCTLKSTLKSTHSGGDIEYVISLRLVGQVGPDDAMFLQFYNIVMRKVMDLLGLEELGRNYYDHNAAIEFPQDNLTLWPGFITAIRNHMRGTLLCVEVTHKVLRTSNVYETMQKLLKPGISQPEYEKLVRAEFVDSIVMTHYNRRTYKISDIDFKTHPHSSFRGQDGTMQPYHEYYKKRYNIDFDPGDLDQPMLVSKPRKKDINKGITGDIYLVPSLCFPTGLTEDMRKNFNLMKRLSTHLHMNPEQRKRALDSFMVKLREDPRVQEEFRNWGIDFSSRPLDTVARLLTREKIIVGPIERGGVDADQKGDWGRQLGRGGRTMLEPVAIRNWLVFTPPHDMEKAKSFIKILKNIGKELGAQVEEPLNILVYDVGRVNEMAIRNLMKPYEEEKIEFVFFILPNNQLRRYVEVKHYFSLKLGIPTQCFLAKTLVNNSINAIASKVMMQVTAKLGGVPWALTIPLKKLMVLGFDVYHCSDRKGDSAGGLVSTTTPALTNYISLVSFHKDKSELSNNLCVDMNTCLVEYLKQNNFLPDRIVLYRDGVGEGQVSYVLSHEVEQVKVAIRDIYHAHAEELPKLTFIIVTKKINTRAFLRDTRGNYTNLDVGTVIDRDITLPERYDFFMVSQDVRQGTVSPSNYNVVYDESCMSADKIQRLSYKMTHLYYNWSGTVAVPAVCQYAHKLAYLTGVALNEKAHKSLETKLWYL